MSKMALFFGCFLVTVSGSVGQARGPGKDSPPPKPPRFQAPKEWQPIEAGLVASARFQIKKGDQVATMTVSGLKEDGGGLAANINRWRAIVGLEPLAEKNALATTQPIKVDGIPGHSVDLTGPDATGKPPARILVAVVKRRGQTWFFKLEGPSDLVATQKSAFDGFLKSVHFENPQPLPKSVQGDWGVVGIEYRGQRPPADILRKYKVAVRDLK